MGQRTTPTSPGQGRPGTLLTLRTLAGRAAVVAVLVVAGAALLLAASAAGRRHRKPFPRPDHPRTRRLRDEHRRSV